MEQVSNPPTQWKTRILKVYALTFASAALLIDFLPIGGYSSIASAFLSSLRTEFLPTGWVLIAAPGIEPFELGATTSLLLAFLLCCPIMAYAAVRLVSPANLGKKTFAALVIGAAVLSYQGAAWGFVLDSLYFLTYLPPMLTITPVLGSYDFYIVLLQGILGWALIFILPIYLILFRGVHESARIAVAPLGQCADDIPRKHSSKFCFLRT